MKIALVGGTHGNEPVGIEVMRLFREGNTQYPNPFQCFWGNPKAYELKKRYVDTDLNRAFGINGIKKGYEEQRSQELEGQIKGHFDLCVDLHTTTSNMGLTLILNNTNSLTQKVCASVQNQIPEVKLIEEDRLDERCNHLNRLCPAGITVEVGPVANNVVDGELVAKMFRIVECIFNHDESKTIDLSDVEYYKMIGQINYPEEKGWYIHSNIDKKDFSALQPKDPVFTNISGETMAYEGAETVYPFFVNEAAYLENRSAFLIAKLKKGF